MDKHKIHPIYGNIEVRHPEGFLMFCANDKRANWYLSRRLAKVIQEDPKVIQLTFTPNGVGRKDEQKSLVYKKNICVVCGSQNIATLSRHHVIPSCYRKNFPNKLKDHNDYDIACTCTNCHEKYETEAQRLKKQLADQYAAPFHAWNNAPNFPACEAQKSAATLLKCRDKMPIERIAILEHAIKKYLPNCTFTDEELNELIAGEFGMPKSAKELTHGYLVVQQLMKTEDGLKDFILLWRKHFVSIMEPKFMPEHWNEYMPLQYAWND